MSIQDKETVLETAHDSETAGIILETIVTDCSRIPKSLYS